jgi:hypothetical protein
LEVQCRHVIIPSCGPDLSDLASGSQIHTLERVLADGP